MIHDFLERLHFSEGVELGEGILRHLLDTIPGSVKITRSSRGEDLKGTDYWIVRDNLQPISIDVKHRDFCPIERFGSDDACIETTSVYRGPTNQKWRDEYRLRPGWTIDQEKRTDLLVYTWPSKSGGRRFWVLYFPHLCRAAQKNWRAWASQYGEKAAANKGYVTLSVYPPRSVIAHAMRELVVGVA